MRISERGLYSIYIKYNINNPFWYYIRSLFSHIKNQNNNNINNNNNNNKNSLLVTLLVYITFTGSTIFI